jgi:hypothetical protein
LTVMDKRWQLVLDCLGAEQPPFSQGTLFNFRMRLIAHDLVQPVGITQRVPRIAVRRISRAVLFSCMSIESVLDADSGHPNSA